MTELVLKIDFIQTLAVAAVVLFAGYGIKRRIQFLDRYNIPAAGARLRSARSTDGRRELSACRGTA